MSSGRRSSMARKDSTRIRIEQMEAEREDRRRAAQERKQSRAQDQQRSKDAGDPGDIDFIRLVRKWRASHQEQAQSHDDSAQENHRICICVRKRPIFQKEIQTNDHDSVSCLHPNVWVHSAKLRVDGISKYLDHNSFCFDHAFDEHATTDDVYRFSTMPLIDDVCSGTGVRATVFAYGQTGSGKTFTMEGIQALVSEDLFLLLSGQESMQVAARLITRQSLSLTLRFMVAIFRTFSTIAIVARFSRMARAKLLFLGSKSMKLMTVNSFYPSSLLETSKCTTLLPHYVLSGYSLSHYILPFHPS